MLVVLPWVEVLKKNPRSLVPTRTYQFSKKKFSKELKKWIYLSPFTAGPEWH